MGRKPGKKPGMARKSEDLKIAAMQESTHLYYKKGYKYQLTRPLYYQTGIDVKQTIVCNKFLTLYKGGMLEIKEDYAYDGPSGWAVDTPDFMRGSAVHDGLYAFLRAGLLPPSLREKVDDIMRSICRQDGMWKWREWYTHKAVRTFAEYASKHAASRKELMAPVNR